MAAAASSSIPPVSGTGDGAPDASTAHGGTAGHRPTRREQSLQSRNRILQAALAEFAEHGFEGASIRSIARRADVQYQLISYYYRTKDVLWHAVAEDAFTGIRAAWDAYDDLPSSPIDRLRGQYFIYFEFATGQPDFHPFLLQEMRTGSPRYEWVWGNYISPLFKRLVPDIEACQRSGQLPDVDPVTIHLMLIGAISTLIAHILSEKPRPTKAALTAAWHAVEYSLLPLAR